MRALLFSLSALTLLGLQSGCDNEVTKQTGGSGGGSSTSTTTSTTTTSSTGTGTSMQSGDCDTDADCAPNGHCIELSPGGFRVCQFPVPEATTCSEPANDECCDSTDCAAPSKCYLGPIVPSCGGPQILPHNQCATDLCSAGSCPGGLCAPAGTVNNAVMTCIASACSKDTDCTAHAGGICATYVDPCCNATTGLACIYPGINCRTSADCGNDSYCGIDASGAPVCMKGGPACPA